jgi:hypothetical protein
VAENRNCGCLSGPKRTPNLLQVLRGGTRKIRSIRTVCNRNPDTNADNRNPPLLRLTQSSLAPPDMLRSTNPSTAHRTRPLAACAILLISTCLSPPHRSSGDTTARAFSIPSSPPPSRRMRRREEDAAGFISGSRSGASSSLDLYRSSNDPPSVDHSPLEDSPWSDDDSYYDRLREASSDPLAFEKFVEESMLWSSSKDDAEKSSTVVASTSSSAAATTEGNDAVASIGTPTKKKYVPIEEWDAGRKNGENLTREERVQWECQRNGDQFRQNEILRQNLKRF